MNNVHFMYNKTIYNFYETILLMDSNNLLQS